MPRINSRPSLKRQISCNDREYTISQSSAGSSIRTAKMHNLVIRKNIYHTSSKSFMADTTNSLFRDRDMPCPRALPIGRLTGHQVRLRLDIPHLLKIGHNPGFIQNRAGCPYPAFEVELQLLDGKRLGDQVKSRVCRQARSVPGKKIKRWSILRLVTVGRCKI